MSRFHHKGSGNQMRMPRYAAFDLLASWITEGVLSGFYDITLEGGALNQLGEPVQGVEDEEIWSLPNLLAGVGGTGNTIIFTPLGQAPSPTYPANNLTWRRSIRLANGLQSSPKIPFAYYPENFVNNQWLATQTNGDAPDNDLIFEIVTMSHLTDSAIGPTDPLPETMTVSTYGFFGCRAIYESQAFIDGMTASGGGAMFDQMNLFPAPEMPSSVIFQQEVIPGAGGFLHMRQRIWIANVLSHDQTTPIEVDGSPITSVAQLTGSALFEQVGMLFGLFCFATQKLFYITKLLTDTERGDLHDALVGTSEFYGHGAN